MTRVTRLLSKNNSGLIFLLSATNLIASPTVTTLPVTGIGAGVATLNGGVNTSNVTTVVLFQYGLTASYDSATRKTVISAATTPVSFSNTVSGLQLETLYHFRAVAYNSTGTNYGDDSTFTTTAATEPTITTNFTSAVGPTNVTLNGMLYCNGLDCGAWFQYGLTTNYENVTIITNLGGGTTNVNFSVFVGSLVAATNYYFRAVATNGLGLVYGIGQSFTTAIFGDVTATVAPGLQGVYNASVAWGDYDNDGQLDFLLTGLLNNNTTSISQIWRNTGNGFANVTSMIAPGLPGVSSGSVAWGDYDNDGRLDFILTGTANAFAGSGGTSQIWHNTGSNFVNVTASVASNLTGVGNSSVAWGDYDNDGRLDFVIAGVSNATPNPGITQIWHNTGSNFVNVTATVAPGLPGISSGTVAWGDYDNDGRLDLWVVGGGTSQIWHNTGSNFVNVTASVAPGLPLITFGSSSCVALGDYDNDGRLDFLITGQLANNTSICQIWHNTGTNFVNVTTSIAPGLSSTALSAAWGDYDNDGRLDLLVDDQVWHNTGSNFVNVTAVVAPSLPASFGGSAAWGDFDNDGRLDALIAGYSGQYPGIPTSIILRNFTPQTNSPPTAPSGLAMTSSANGALLSWNAATDAQTPSTALTYNVRAGTDPGGTNLLAAHSAANGFRLLPAMGNAQERRFLHLAGVTNGQTVNWSVQAVDNSFVGGPFSTQCGAISIPQMDLATSNGTSAALSWSPPTWGWRLQESSDLITWSDSPIGEVNPVTISPTNTAEFYRLLNP